MGFASMDKRLTDITTKLDKILELLHSKSSRNSNTTKKGGK